MSNRVKLKKNSKRVLMSMYNLNNISDEFKVNFVRRGTGLMTSLSEHRLFLWKKVLTPNLGDLK